MSKLDSRQVILYLCRRVGASVCEQFKDGYSHDGELMPNNYGMPATTLLRTKWVRMHATASMQAM